MSTYGSLVQPIVQKVAGLEQSYNPLEREVLSRLGNFALISMMAITNTADTVIGVLAEVLNTATGGKIRPLCGYADGQLNHSKFIVAQPYRHLICLINPKANPVASSGQDGICASKVKTFLIKAIGEIRDSDNLFLKHVVSRLGYALMAVALTISRIVDGIIGVGAVILSIVTLGKIDKINQAAFHGLQCTGVVKDILYCVRKMVNPYAGIYRSKFKSLN